MPHAHANPFLHQNKPSRESIFCDKASDWLTNRALIMLNFLPKTIQKEILPYTREWAKAPKTCTLTATHVRGCWACCSRAAETTSWKSRSKMELTACFQLVETVMNNYFLISFLRNNHFWTQVNGAEIQILSYLSTVLRT